MSSGAEATYADHMYNVSDISHHPPSFYINNPRQLFSSMFWPRVLDQP